MSESTPTNSGESHIAASGHEWWIKRSWTRLWWVGLNPNDESLALMDTHTYYRAWTRERLIAKLTRPAKPSPWEVING